MELDDVESCTYDGEIQAKAEEMKFPVRRPARLVCASGEQPPAERSARRSRAPRRLRLAASLQGIIDIRQKQDTFIFTVETTGVLKPEEIVKQGAPSEPRKRPRSSPWRHEGRERGRSAGLSEARALSVLRSHPCAQRQAQGGHERCARAAHGPGGDGPPRHLEQQRGQKAGVLKPETPAVDDPP